MAQYKIGVNNKIKISADRIVIYTISDQHRGRRRQNKSRWIKRCHKKFLYLKML